MYGSSDRGSLRSRWGLDGSTSDGNSVAISGIGWGGRSGVGSAEAGGAAAEGHRQGISLSRWTACGCHPVGSPRQSMSVAGKSTSLPSIAMFGVTPVTLCTVILYAAINVSRRCGQLWGLSCTVVRSIWRSVRFRRSTWPSHCGWKAVVWDFWTPVRSHSSWNNLLSKFFPRSLWICLGRPNRAKNPS